MKPAKPALAALTLAALLAGCVSNKAYIPVVSTLSSSGTPEMITAPSDGDYLLYRTDGNVPFARTFLRAGEPLGFKTGATDSAGMPVGAAGTLCAVAGKFAVPVNPGDSLEWRHNPNTDPNNPNRKTNFLLGKP